ncbi:hypothetical protein AAFF_G00213450 [Aldrovandia affinis]|uniref:Kinase suppressor RAS 1 N-terminal helical hairpin domain-containing protein n=1 Tax=Aldrovandia affinis TaxID=143900 RepID=A0AAD7RGY8_9TELE|nr:hypothetical protein AAFF_G00213450 [Aldrovandia affinis]
MPQVRRWKKRPFSMGKCKSRPQHDGWSCTGVQGVGTSIRWSADHTRFIILFRSGCAQCRGMDSVSGKGGKMVESDEPSGRASGGVAAMAALKQCKLIQNLIDISIASLQGLRTKCAASNDLTQQEIRTLEVKLVKYICKQLQFKQRVPESERPPALNTYPRLCNWLETINLRAELIQAVPVKLSLDALLQMSGSQVWEMMRRLGSSSEECSRLSAALSCLRSATESGGEVREDRVPWISEPPAGTPPPWIS